MGKSQLPGNHRFGSIICIHQCCFVEVRASCVGFLCEEMGAMVPQHGVERLSVFLCLCVILRRHSLVETHAHVSNEITFAAEYRRGASPL